MNFQYLTLSFLTVCLLSACASSPMKARLDQSFVYNCSLQLIDKNVPAAEAEKVCTASHRAEMLEQDRRMQPAAEAKKPVVEAPASAPEAAPEVKRAPASAVQEKLQ